MRYPAERKRETRAKIVAAAARRFRARGYRGAGVDEVMKAAGLTAGGFYAHFSSKEELFAEAVATSLGQLRGTLLAGLDELPDAERMRRVVGRYLSRTHRDHPEQGCPLPALAAEVAREGTAGKRALEAHVRTLVGELSPRTPPLPGLTSEDRVLATVGLLVGGLLLARAVKDPDLSDRILTACRRLAVPERSPE
jgi:TetR/AcrR family transcriptional repressor of nem operon